MIKDAPPDHVLDIIELAGELNSDHAAVGTVLLLMVPRDDGDDDLSLGCVVPVDRARRADMARALEILADSLRNGNHTHVPKRVHTN